MPSRMKALSMSWPMPLLRACGFEDANKVFVVCLRSAKRLTLLLILGRAADLLVELSANLVEKLGQAIVRLGHARRQPAMRVVHDGGCAFGGRLASRRSSRQV